MPCPSCNGNDIAEDNSQTLTQYVCVDCGTVLDVQNQFRTNATQSDYDQTYSNNFPQRFAQRNPALHRIYNKAKEHTSTYDAGLDNLKRLAIHCKTPSNVTEEAEQLFKTACLKPSLKYLHAEKKSMLSATCFYVTARKCDIPISISHIASFMRVAAHEISEVYKIVKEEFQVDVTKADPEALVGGFLHELSVEALNNKETTSRMKEILNLTKLSLLSTGVGTQQLLLAVCYVAWCSLNVRKRKIPTFYKFCGEYKLKTTHGSAASKRVDEIIKMLVDLANNLPSLSGLKIDKKSIFWNLDSVLMFPTMAMSGKRSLEEDEDESSYTFVRKSTTKRRCPDSSCSENETMPNVEDLDRPELDEKDIPDTEMHKYLRNESEIKFIKTLQK